MRKFSQEILYYECLAEFRQQYYKNLLTSDHLQGGKKRLPKVTGVDGSIMKSEMWGWEFIKDGKKYFLPDRYTQGGETKLIDLNSTLPFIADKVLEGASGEFVYSIIQRTIPAKLKPQKTMTFKELVDVLSNLQHTNPTHYKLYNGFIGLTSMIGRANFRIATAPGFGKDSAVTLYNCLIGGAHVLVSPTIAKLEFRTISKWLVVSEINDIKKDDWKTIEQFLLDVGAHKPDAEKRSREFKGTKETLDLKNFSIALIYNQITDYPKPDDYVDSISKEAVKDRFPALRLSGVITEDFNQKNIDVQKVVAENMEFYKELARNIEYYKLNINKELKCFNADKLVKMPSRWKRNIGVLLKTIDLYCDTQEEFDKWIEVINNAIEDYKEMLLYPDLYKSLEKKGVDAQTKAMIYKANTFIEKNNIIRAVMQDKKVSKEDKSFWS